MSKVLFHVSKQTDVINKFKPRIPGNRAHLEDETKNRVCLSDSIEGCLTAVSWGSMCLEDMFIGTLDASKLIRVYEFNVDDIDKEELLLPQEVFSRGLVNDALVTGEHWYTGNELIPNKTYLIELSDYLDVSTSTYKDGGFIEALNSKGNISYKLLENMENEMMTEIYEAIYNIIPEENRSGIVERKYKVSEELDSSDVLYELEKIFDYNEKNRVTIKNGYMFINVDTRLDEINIEKFDELIKDIVSELPIDTTVAIA